MKTQWKAVTSYWCKKNTWKNCIIMWCGWECTSAFWHYIYIMFIWRVWEFYCKKISKHRRNGSPLNGWTVMLECYWNRSWSDGMSCWCCKSWVLENGGACHGHFGWESGIRSHRYLPVPIGWANLHCQGGWRQETHQGGSGGWSWRGFVAEFVMVCLKSWEMMTSQLIVCSWFYFYLMDFRGFAHQFQVPNA